MADYQIFLSETDERSAVDVNKFLRDIDPEKLNAALSTGETAAEYVGVLVNKLNDGHLENIRLFIKGLENKLKDCIASSSEFEIKVGLKAGAEGNGFVMKASGEASIELRICWKGEKN